MGARAMLVAVFLMSTVSVKAQEGKVEFWKKNVTLTCPKSGTWHYGKDKFTQETLELEYKHPVKLFCEYTDEDKTLIYKYNFYVKGKVCENCFELDAEIFGMTIFLDVVLTAVLMFIIYKLTKRKSSDGHAPVSKPPAHSRNQPPNVPNRDYETLNLQTRSADTYSTVVNRTG
ncbi:T-cell surface glycoprotein CD3 epsilon chain-like [Menidia menidia]|uniref:(Atlantic silverside) hypothetical protein n=1 Tax=Menidia menidia TaxID=238744 RepID=A0A8S4BT05_9TELE|nr:unnamed protein product [Menidia menidia]